MKRLLVPAALAAQLASAQAPAGTLRSYAYVSPGVGPILARSALQEAELLALVDRETARRGLAPVLPNAVYEGSEDSLRLDLRRKPEGLVLELSVRQGASVHNMLERWRGARTLPLDGHPPKVDRAALLAQVAELLQALESAYGTPSYREGRMMESD